MNEEILIRIPESNTIYDATAQIFQFICDHILDRQLEGVENIPKEGPAIICPNHQFFKDLGIVGAAFWNNGQRLKYLAKIELFRYGFQYLLRPYGAIPLNRRRPTPVTYRHLESLLEQDSYILIFPQGTRKKGYIGRPHFDIARKVILPYEDRRRQNNPEFEIPFVPVGLNYDEASKLHHLLPWDLGVRLKIGTPLYSDKSMIHFREYEDDDGFLHKVPDYRPRNKDLSKRILQSLSELSSLPKQKPL